MNAHCSICGTENPADSKFCRSCGKKFVPVAPAVEAGEPGVYYCYKHKNETTRVTCGRCERPLCPKCVTVGANGVRCRHCARNKTPVRLSGVLHDTGSAIGRGVNHLGTRPVWYLWLWATIIRIIAGFFGR
jgi:hypothetical protein